MPSVTNGNVGVENLNNNKTATNSPHTESRNCRVLIFIILFSRIALSRTLTKPQQNAANNARNIQLLNIITYTSILLIAIWPREITIFTSRIAFSRSSKGFFPSRTMSADLLTSRVPVLSAIFSASAA